MFHDYFTVSIPFIEREERPTVWHPTERGFAPLHRGAFPTAAAAHRWAYEKIPGHRYELVPISMFDEIREGDVPADVVGAQYAIAERMERR